MRSACEPIGWAEADLAKWQRAMRPFALAVNLIHHPDKPDGVGLARGSSLAANRFHHPDEPDGVGLAHGRHAPA